MTKVLEPEVNKVKDKGKTKDVVDVDLSEPPSKKHKFAPETGNVVDNIGDVDAGESDDDNQEDNKVVLANWHTEYAEDEDEESELDVFNPSESDDDFDDNSDSDVGAKPQRKSSRVSSRRSSSKIKLPKRVTRSSSSSAAVNYREEDSDNSDEDSVWLDLLDYAVIVI
ncbi:hypothetical protein HK096_001177 [Nowakowskiella sp. JEL0078]|nr:hypothetical protein HK096_001177 [Nowakowskiella sp. JEL0078]